MTEHTPCPPADRLKRLVAGDLPAAEQAELIAHLDTCRDCQRQLDTLAGADPALLAAAGTMQGGGFAAEAPLRRVLDRLRTEGFTLTFRPQDRASWVRSLLRPAESLEALGRLEDYQVEQLLGQGGMGVVLRAFDPAL